MNKFLKVLTLALTLMLSSNLLVFAETSSSIQDKIDGNKERIDELEDEKDRINDEIEIENNELQGILAQIDEISDELRKAQGEVDYYQRKIDDVQEEINSINSQIETSKNEIESREKIIKEKEEEAIEIQKNIEKRLISYYKMDVVTNYIYLILQSENLMSLFDSIQNVYRIIRFDKTLIDKAREVQAQVQAEKEEISNQLIKIEENKEIVVAKQEELKLSQDEYLVKAENHQSKMNELNSLESEKTIIIASLTDKESKLQSEIGDLIAYNEELQLELDRIFAEINNSNNSSGGNNAPSGNIVNPGSETFLRPGKGVVTDTYGPRINPVTGEAGFHTGVDLADPSGADVYASKSGRVVYSGWISGYGNTIIIDHGAGIQTLYAHNSQLLVSVGESVYRGQVVAKVGSTGMSTGPHIHWEIRINGVHTDPTPYV